MTAGKVTVCTPRSRAGRSGAAAASFFEIGSLFVLASGSVEHLNDLQGRTAHIDRRRFRPNLYIDTGPGAGSFVEDGWAGGTLARPRVVLGDIEPTLWCITSTLPQADLPRDQSVLRTVARHHRGRLGVYCSVHRIGRLRVGDPVSLHPSLVSLAPGSA